VAGRLGGEGGPKGRGRFPGQLLGLGPSGVPKSGGRERGPNVRPHRESRGFAAARIKWREGLVRAQISGDIR
jgi:hypothetical protein